MSPDRQNAALPLDGFPRVSGDEPGVEGYADLARAFSPRERG